MRERENIVNCGLYVFHAAPTVSAQNLLGPIPFCPQPPVLQPQCPPSESASSLEQGSGWGGEGDGEQNWFLCILV